VGEEGCERVAMTERRRRRNKQDRDDEKRDANACRPSGFGNSVGLMGQQCRGALGY
jgi:hypothetical protein